LLDGIEASGRTPGYGLSSGRIDDWLKKSGVDSLPPDWQADGGRLGDFERIASDLGRKLLPGTYARASREDVLFTGPRKEAALKIWDQWMATIPAKESMWEDSLTAARLNKVLEGNPSLKFVTHDWSRDPLFYDSPAALEKIELARIAAVRKLARREDQHDVLRGFLRDSGLYGAFGQSLGIKVETLSP